MNKKERKVIEDLQAFIKFGLENDMAYWTILGTLAHDTRGLFQEDKTFLPRTAGYSKKV